MLSFALKPKTEPAGVQYLGILEPRKAEQLQQKSRSQVRSAQPTAEGAPTSAVGHFFRVSQSVDDMAGSAGQAQRLSYADQREIAFRAADLSASLVIRADSTFVDSYLQLRMCGKLG